MEIKLKRKKDWEGRYVRLLRSFDNQGGTHFAAGTVMLVRRNFGGLRLDAVPKQCELCRLSSARGLSEISERDVELLPKEFVPAKTKLEFVSDERVKSQIAAALQQYFPAPSADEEMWTVTINDGNRTLHTVLIADKRQNKNEDL
jgi:hypothetical protein